MYIKIKGKIKHTFASNPNLKDYIKLKNYRHFQNYAASTDKIHNMSFCNRLPSIKQTFYLDVLKVNPITFKAFIYDN